MRVDMPGNGLPAGATDFVECGGVVVIHRKTREEIGLRLGKAGTDTNGHGDAPGDLLPELAQNLDKGVNQNGDHMKHRTVF